MTTRLTAAIEDAILTGIADGVPLRQLCRLRQVQRGAVYRRIEGDADFAARMARARALGFDAIADEALEIADDGRNDWMEREAPDGSKSEARNPENIARSKLRIDTRMRLLARWDPKRYGEGLAGTGAGTSGEGGAGEATDPVAMVARLASLLATLAARDSGEDDHDPD